MEKELPVWLNKEFLTLSLQEGGRNVKPGVEISNFSLKLAVAPGNNYTSDVYRVNVEYNNEGGPDQQTISLIVKAPLQNGAVGEYLGKINIFHTDPKIYRTVLPIFSEIVKYDFGPKYLFSNEKNCLVLKDLMPEGYRVCDRFKQLDVKHCRKVISCLAKFHAASVAYHHRNPDFMSTVHECFYMEEGPMVEEMKATIDSCFKLFIETLISKGYSAIFHYVSERLDNIWKSVVETCAPRSDSLNVLNHGDCWTSNLLFKYDDSGDIEDVKFIDYQLVRYSSPATDLLYFIWSSGNEEVRDNHQEELYNLYLQTLNQTLEELGCVDILTQEMLNASIKSSSDWILLAIAFTVPFTVCDPDNVIDFESVKSEDMKNGKLDEKYRTLYNSKQFQGLLPGYLRQFDKIMPSH